MSERGDESESGTQGADKDDIVVDASVPSPIDESATEAAPDGDAAADKQSATSAVEPPNEAVGGSVLSAADAPSRASKLWWLLPVAVVIEFWIYGHNGYVDVCVGKDGETDFELRDQERTDDNRWKFPHCETRLNLGLRSQFDARVQEGTKAACRGATLFKNRGEAKQCTAGTDSWTHVVTGRMSWPWDRNYYEHLFWFLR